MQHLLRFVVTEGGQRLLPLASTRLQSVRRQGAPRVPGNREGSPPDATDPAHRGTSSSVDEASTRVDIGAVAAVDAGRFRRSYRARWQRAELPNAPCSALATVSPRDLPVPRRHGAQRFRLFRSYARPTKTATRHWSSSRMWDLPFFDRLREAAACAWLRMARRPTRVHSSQVRGDAAVMSCLCRPIYWWFAVVTGKLSLGYDTSVRAGRADRLGDGGRAVVRGAGLMLVREECCRVA